MPLKIEHEMLFENEAFPLRFLLKQPSIRARNSKAIILLHGVGSNESDLFGLANDLPDDFLIISPRGPFKIGEHSYAWYQVDFSTGRPIINETQENVDNDGSYELWGDLTIKGIAKRIKLDVEFGGVEKDPWGNEKAGFSINGKINRKDWGLNWNTTLETGGLLVSNDVTIIYDVQLARSAAALVPPSCVRTLLGKQNSMELALLNKSESLNSIE